MCEVFQLPQNLESPFCYSSAVARCLRNFQVFWWLDRNLSSFIWPAAHLRGTLCKLHSEAVILVWAKKRQVGEKGRDVLITTLPRKLSHVGRRGGGGGRAGEKKWIRGKTLERFKKHVHRLSGDLGSVCMQKMCGGEGAHVNDRAEPDSELLVWRGGGKTESFR